MQTDTQKQMNQTSVSQSMHSTKACSTFLFCCAIIHLLTMNTNVWTFFNWSSNYDFNGGELSVWHKLLLIILICIIDLHKLILPNKRLIILAVSAEQSHSVFILRFSSVFICYTFSYCTARSVQYNCIAVCSPGSLCKQRRGCGS